MSPARVMEPAGSQPMSVTKAARARILVTAAQGAYITPDGSYI